MKKRLCAVTIALLAGVALWWVMSQKSRSASATTESAGIVATSAVPELSAAVTPDHVPEDAESLSHDNAISLPGPVVNNTRAPKALASAEEIRSGPEIGEPGSGLTPAAVLENLRSVFRQYHLRFGANPVGDNSEITASLNGQNPRQVNFVNAEDGLRMNERGELVDNWGTPFFFHQLSRTEMEIHSAGPDRKMWSSDDLVLK